MYTINKYVSRIICKFLSKQVVSRGFWYSWKRKGIFIIESDLKCKRQTVT